MSSSVHLLIASLVATVTAQCIYDTVYSDVVQYGNNDFCTSLLAHPEGYYNPPLSTPPPLTSYGCSQLSSAVRPDRGNLSSRQDQLTIAPVLLHTHRIDIGYIEHDLVTFKGDHEHDSNLVQRQGLPTRALNIDSGIFLLQQPHSNSPEEPNILLSAANPYSVALYNAAQYYWPQSTILQRIVPQRDRTAGTRLQVAELELY
jgi:hypothetical protein